MRLVIDISENIYNLIAKGEDNRDFVYKSDLMRTILEGTPLPKGHGRLFDERDIVNGNYEIIGNRIYELEPIIEADKS